MKVSLLALLLILLAFSVSANVLAQIQDSGTETRKPLSEILESPYHPFCKNRLTPDEFKWIKLYAAQLQTSESGQRLIQLLFDSLTTDESRNKYRHGGYRVVQNDDHRMKGIDTLIFANQHVESLRKELRKNNLKAFECVEGFEMVAAGRMLVEDLETGKARMPPILRKNIPGESEQKDHRYDDDDDDGDETVEMEQEEGKLHEENANSKNQQKTKKSDADPHDRFEKHRRHVEERETPKSNSNNNNNGGGKYSHEESDAVDTDFASSAVANHHNKYQGMHPNEVHLYQHATEHFMRHEQAKIEHQRYHEQILNQRLAHNQNSQHREQLLGQNKKNNNLNQDTKDSSSTSLTAEQQKSMQQSFDHMQTHFKHHAHQMAAQRKLLEEQTKKVKEQHQARMAAEKAQYDSERYGGSNGAPTKN